MHGRVPTEIPGLGTIVIDETMIFEYVLKIRCLRSCPCFFVNNGLAIAIKLMTIHFHGFWVPRSGMTTIM